MPFVQSTFPHPQPTSRSRRQNPKNIFSIREWKPAQSGSKTRDHPIYGRPHRRAQRQYPRLPARKAPPRLRRPVASAAQGNQLPPGVQRHPSDLLRQLQQTPDKLLTFL